MKWLYERENDVIKHFLIQIIQVSYFTILFLCVFIVVFTLGWELHRCMTRYDNCEKCEVIIIDL